MDETCVCGDVADEHERTRTGLGACEVEGCPCIHFERDPDADEVIEDDDEPFPLAG